jgi:hypothetical protein
MREVTEQLGGDGGYGDKLGVEGKEAVRPFANEYLIKTNDPNDKLKFGKAYQLYLAFCQKEGKKEYEKKNDFKKALKDIGYKIENSKKDGNQVCIFNVKVIEENE